MKSFLITGASRGLGAALAERFGGVTVARSGDVTEKGDIRDKDFREHLIFKYTPDVFINNAGISGFDNDPFDVLETNYQAATELMFGFYEKMKTGKIINIGSMATHVSGHGQSLGRMSYVLSKRNIEQASDILNQVREKPIDVCYLSPGMIETTIDHGEKKRTPMKVDDIVDVVEWLLSVPPHLKINKIEVDNK